MDVYLYKAYGNMYALIYKKKLSNNCYFVSVLF